MGKAKAVRIRTDLDIRNAKAGPGERLEIRDEKAPGLILRVTDNGVKSWVLRYRADGAHRRFKIGDAKRIALKDARIEAWRLYGEIEKGADPQGEKRRAREIADAQTIRTVNDLLDAYEKACEAGEWKPKKKRKRPQTLTYEKALTDRHIRPKIGKLVLAECTRPVVKALLRKMIDGSWVGEGREPRPIGAQTNRVQAIIRQSFNWAIAEELVQTNPAVGFASLHDQAPRQRIWSDADLKLLWPALKDPSQLRDPDGARVFVGRPLAIALQLCLILLQRRTEVAGMALSELDLEARTWLIPPERIKTNKPHRVPLPPHAIDLIQQAIKLAQGDDEEPPKFVFPSSTDKLKPVRPDSLTHAMTRVREAIGVSGAHIHDLRRTGSTALTSERLGVSPFIRSAVLGHTTDAGGGASVSHMHYDANDYLPEKRRALEAWENLLLEIVGERTQPSNVRPIREAVS